MLNVRVEDRIVTIGDLFATIYKALGIDWTKEYMSPIERPIKIANSIGGGKWISHQRTILITPTNLKIKFLIKIPINTLV